MFLNNSLPNLRTAPGIVAAVFMPWNLRSPATAATTVRPRITTSTDPGSGPLEEVPGIQVVPRKGPAVLERDVTTFGSYELEIAAQ